jgi:hypothetical protein
VNRIRRGFTVLFAVLIFLVPVPVRPQNGGDGVAAFKKILEDRGLPFEEGFLFSDPGPRGEPKPGEGETAGAAKAGPSLTLRFPGNAGGAAKESSGEAPAGEWYGTAPLMIAAFPAESRAPPDEAGGGESPEEDPGGTYGFKIALALAEQLRARQAEGRGLPGDLLIAFLGDEDVRQYREAGGRSAGELSSYGGIIREPENTVFWFFDMEEAPQSVLIRHGTAQTIAPLESLKNLTKLFVSLKIPYKFAVPFNEMYKLKFAGGPEILSFTQARGMGALFFSGSSRPGAGGRETVSAESLGELILSYSASLERPGENQDYHYLLIPWGGKTIFLSQGHTALVLFLLAAVFFLVFLFYIFFRPVPPARIMLFFRCFWTIPVYFLLLFVSLEAAGLAASLLAGPETQIPRIYGWAAGKVFLGLGLFALISIPLGGYRIPRRAVFYGQNALLLIILDIFIAAWADICFIPFFIGAFLLIFLGSRIKGPVPVYLCALLAPFYGFTALAFSIFSGYGGLGTFLLSSGPGPTALMILVFLPFVLLFKRAMNLHRREKSKILRRLIPFFIFFGLALILGIILRASR